MLLHVDLVVDLLLCLHLQQRHDGGVHLLLRYPRILGHVMNIIVTACSPLGVIPATHNTDSMTSPLGDATSDTFLFVARAIDCVRHGCMQSTLVPGPIINDKRLTGSECGSELYSTISSQQREIESCQLQTTCPVRWAFVDEGVLSLLSPLNKCGNRVSSHWRTPELTPSIDASGFAAVAIAFSRSLSRALSLLALMLASWIALPLLVGFSHFAISLRP